MFLKKIYIEKFRVLKNIEIQFEKEFTPTIFPLGSLNGGGKSTLLQLVFTLLHCLFNEKRHQYLVNLLSTLTLSKQDITTLAKFDILHDDKEFYLEFILADNHFEGQNFNVFLLNVEELEQKLEENKRLKAKYSSLLKLENKMNSSNRVSPSREQWQEILRYINTIKADELYKIARENESDDDYKKLLDHLLRPYKENYDDDLYLMLKEEKNKQSKIRHLLKSKEMLYVTHLDNKKVLLCKTNIDDPNVLTKMSDKVYLAAPSTQVFLFLSDKEKKAVFSKESGIENYVNYINEAKKNLTGFFTYDFASTDLIIKSFEKARNKDFEDALEYGEYGNHFKALKTELNRFLIDKTITVNKQLSSIIFKLKNDDEKLLPEDFSHGELKKLGIYIWLKYYAIEDSLVLMDEIEIGLHPDWQYEIVNELQEWSKNNQFLLATHSYELCQALTPSHVKELEPKLIKTK
jgi:predicted ATPase